MPPKMVQVVGGFSRGGEPARGQISFIPSRFWVYNDDQYWAVLSPTIELDASGQFAVLLTPTDTDTVPWYYLLRTDAGSWVIGPKGTKMQHLRKLIDEHHPGPRAP